MTAHSSSPDRPESRADTEIPAATPPRLWPPTAHRVTPGVAATIFAGSPVARKPMSYGSLTMTTRYPAALTSVRRGT